MRERDRLTNLLPKRTTGITGTIVSMASLIFLVAACASQPSSQNASLAPQNKEKAAALSEQDQRRRSRIRVDAPASADLMGHNGNQLRALFGEPSLTRKEVNAEVWQYEGQVCVLFFYLYKTTGTPTAVKFIDARSAFEQPEQPMTPDQCIEETLRDRKLS